MIVPVQNAVFYDAKHIPLRQTNPRDLQPILPNPFTLNSPESAGAEHVFSAHGACWRGAASATRRRKSFPLCRQVAARLARTSKLSAPRRLLLPQEGLRRMTAGRSWRPARLFVASTPLCPGKTRGVTLFPGARLRTLSPCGHLRGIPFSRAWAGFPARGGFRPPDKVGISSHI